ncbi:MAG: DegV family protein [Anaerolineae bacterium]|nr:DegV family protein [Anaerolineae bacterium]
MKIITDNAADLLPQEVQDLDIQVAPLFIQFPDQTEIASADIAPDAFYDRLRSIAPQVPTTSQPSPGEFIKLYRQVAAAGEEVLSLHISSGLSGTYNAASLAAGQVSEAKVTVVDTQTLSPAERFQVLAAAYAAKAGWSTPQILERLNEIRAASEAIFTLETLEYLARGGRIGRVQALAGSILHIKPIIHVDKADGKYSTIGRARTMNQAISGIADHLAKQYDKQTPVWATVIHGQAADRAEQMAEILKERLNVGKLDIIRISPVLGVHTGPGVVGAGIVPLKLFKDLGM